MNHNLTRCGCGNLYRYACERCLDARRREATAPAIAALMGVFVPVRSVGRSLERVVTYDPHNMSEEYAARRQKAIGMLVGTNTGATVEASWNPDAALDAFTVRVMRMMAGYTPQWRVLRVVSRAASTP